MARRLKGKKESLLVKEMFEFYYLLGEKRTLALVAKHFDKAKVSVDHWSAKYNWAERIERRTVEAYKAIREKMEEDKEEGVERIKKRYQNIINILLKNFEKKLKEEFGKIVEINNIHDFQELAKLDLFLRGEATGREEQTIVFEDYDAREEKKEGKKEKDATDESKEDKKLLKFPQEHQAI